MTHLKIFCLLLGLSFLPLPAHAMYSGEIVEKLWQIPSPPKTTRWVIIRQKIQDKRAELYAFTGLVDTRAELAPIGHRLADGLGAPSLSGSQVAGFESQGVVFVFGDVFFVSRRFVSHPHCLFGLQQVFGEPFQHLLLKQEFIHDER